MCSVHFKVSAYNCPTDLANSRLLPLAVPELVDCPNPPKQEQCLRKPPKKLSPKKSRKSARSETSVESAGVEPDISTEIEPSSEPPAKVERKDCDVQLKEALQHIEKLKKEKNLMKRKLLRAKKKSLDTEFSARKYVDNHNKVFVDNLLSKLPNIPKNLFKVLLKKTKGINNWSREKDSVKLSLAVYFRSTAAYKVLRSCGFVLPHPNTLRKRFRDVLQKPGFCPKLKDMLRIRATCLENHEKQVTLSLDGMTIQEGIVYHKHDDSLHGFVNYGGYAPESHTVANQGILFMIRGLTLRWKQIIGYFVAQNSIKYETLQVLILNAINFISECGFTTRLVVIWTKSRVSGGG